MGAMALNIFEGIGFLGIFTSIFYYLVYLCATLGLTLKIHAFHLNWNIINTHLLIIQCIQYYFINKFNANHFKIHVLELLAEFLH